MFRKQWLGSLMLILFAAAGALAEKPKNVVLLGQKRDHPAGSHEYMSGLHVLAKCLEGVPNLRTKICNADEPCPDAPQWLQQADAIVLYLGEGGTWMQLEPKRAEAVDALAARGGGIVGIHLGIAAKKEKYIPRSLELLGGVHGGSDRKWVMTETDVQPVDRQHPILAGVEFSRLDDEYYYRLKFAKQGTLTPILRATIDGQPETIAWTFERPDGGRSFGFGGMHYHKNWSLPACRRLIAQGILWTLKLPIPKEGLPVDVTEEDLKIR
jgi:hypothetical protein